LPQSWRIRHHFRNVRFQLYRFARPRCLVILVGCIAVPCDCAAAGDDDALSSDPATGAATSPVPAI
jgi:hypothetical protein